MLMCAGAWGEEYDTATYYYWTGGGDIQEDGHYLWTDSENWSTSKDGNVKVPDGHYPGYKDGDTAVFAADTVTFPPDMAEDKKAVNIDKFTVENENSTITIQRESFSYNVFIYSSTPKNISKNETIIIDADNGKINTFAHDGETNSLTLGTVTVKSGTFQVGGALDLTGNLTIESGAYVWSLADVKIGGNLSIETDATLTYRNNVTVTKESDIKGTITPNKSNDNIDSTGNLTFNGAVTNSGTIIGALKNIETPPEGNNNNEDGVDSTSNKYTGNGSISATTLTNTGTITLNSGSISATTLINNGTLTVTENGSLTAETLINKETPPKNEDGDDSTSNEYTGNGSISLNSGSLTVTGSGASSISQVSVNDGTIENAGSGALSINSLSAGDNEKSDKAGSVSVTNSGGGTIFIDSAAFYAEAVSVTNGNAKEKSLTFGSFSATEMGGGTVSFEGWIDIVDGDSAEGKLTLTGNSAESRLEITSGSSGVIYLPRAQRNGNYLSVSEKVTIGGTKPDAWDGTQPYESYTTYNSKPADENVERIYGWIFVKENEFYWLGDTDKSWKEAGNWLINTPDGYRPASSSPDGSASVFINAKRPDTDADDTDADIDNFPVLDENTDVFGVEIGEGASLSFAGYNFTVSDNFSNNGTIYLQGTETVEIPANTKDNGTWAFFRDGSGGGTLQPITNLDYNKVVAEGSGNFRSFTAKEFIIRLPESDGETSATEISLTADATGTGDSSEGSGSEKEIEINAPVTINAQTKITVNAESLSFTESVTLAAQTTINANTATSLSFAKPVTLFAPTTITAGSAKVSFTFKGEITDKKETNDPPNNNLLLTFECTTEENKYNTLSFEGIVSAHLQFIGNADLSSSDFDSESGKVFEQNPSYNFTLGTKSDTESASTAKTAKLIFGKKKVIIGNLIVNAGSIFTQTNEDNEHDTQSVASIVNDGTVIWDSGDAGGTLTLNGSVTGNNADKTVFGKKSVTVDVDGNAELSGVFFDLTIESDSTVTNGSGITVRHNFKVNGGYNESNNGTKPPYLQFGEIVIDGKTFGSEDGEIGGESEGLNLGNVIFEQRNTSKTVDFGNHIVTFESLSLNKSLSLNDTTENAGKITFKTHFIVKGNFSNKGDDGSSPKFEISILDGAEFKNGAEFNTTGTVRLGGSKDKKFVSNDGDLFFAGEVVLESDTEMELHKNKVTFASTVTADSTTTPQNTSFLKISGDSVFMGDVSLNGFVELGGNVSAKPKPESSDKKISITGAYIRVSGESDCAWEAKVGSLDLNSNVFVTLVNGTLTIRNNENNFNFNKNLFCLSGEISFDGKAPNIPGDFALFGRAYNADDPRFAGQDTRFGYYGFVCPFDFAPEEFNGSVADGAEISIGGNLYVNGADLSGIHFIIPDNSNSEPAYNPDAAVTEKQWGLPYAVVFNSAISNSSVSCAPPNAPDNSAPADGADDSDNADNPDDLDGSAFIAASEVAQGCRDEGGNSGFQFEIPRIVSACSITDKVIRVSFNIDIENSKGEAKKAFEGVNAGEKNEFVVITNKDKTLHFDGKLYTDSDCTTEVDFDSNGDIKAKDSDGNPIFYYLQADSEMTWNTDASGSSAGNDDSTDKSGKHQSIKIDLAIPEGLLYAAEGKTMCRNYGSGLWKDDGEGEYKDADSYNTLDNVRPVLVAVYTGQELHTPNTGAADSQRFYDAHNFIEFRYSEPVNIGDMSGKEGAGLRTQNIQAESTFSSASEHGGAIRNNEDGDGIEIAGFARIASGNIAAGYRNGAEHTSDTAKPHALYRRFARAPGEAEAFQPCRVRISIAGFVDEENPISLDSGTFHNWTGYIDSGITPSGKVTILPNEFITDCAVDTDGTALKNILDTESSPADEVNSKVPENSLYGEWDLLPPVFAVYVTNFDDSVQELSWNSGDSGERQYEILGTVNSNTNAYIDKIEMHLFDNAQKYSSDDAYKWMSRSGWYENGSQTSIHAPEDAGGSRGFSAGSSKTTGGIRRSSLAGASAAFTYRYRLDSYESPERDFDTSEISQNVKSPLFRAEGLSETITRDDGLYIGISLNSGDANLPIRTVFTVSYDPSKSFITDLAGNRLTQKDSGSDKKTLRTVEVTPPSFTMTISPVGEDKIYAVFTKPLAYKGTYLHELAPQELEGALEKICTNIEFVSSDGDDVDTNDIKDVSVKSAKLMTRTDGFTALLFTLDRKITLSDVETVWLRVNNEGEETETLFGKVTAPYIQDIFGNSVPAHTCHALSDFAVNAVNVLYAYADSGDDDWDEQGIYGTGIASESSDYAVHDFSADGKNYSRLRAGKDIIFQFEFTGGAGSEGKFAAENGEDVELVFDAAANIRPTWRSDKYNLLTGSDWRIWLDSPLNSLASDYSRTENFPQPEFADVEDSETLKNMTLRKDIFNLSAGNEYQFFFKILGKDKKPLEINHDGDKTTPRIPLYTFRMPKERIAAGDFSFIDLWSFSVSDITHQRGGVTILNNVINASTGEKTAIGVDMKSSGNLNIYVMTLEGNVIRRLAKGMVSAGTHYYYWDGKNNAGKPVARGLYFVRVAGNGIDETRKVMVVK